MGKITAIGCVRMRWVVSCQGLEKVPWKVWGPLKAQGRDSHQWTVFRVPIQTGVTEMTAFLLSFLSDCDCVNHTAELHFLQDLCHTHFQNQDFCLSFFVPKRKVKQGI